MSGNGPGEANIPAGGQDAQPTGGLYNGVHIVTPRPSMELDLTVVTHHSPLRIMVSAVPGGPKMSVMPDSGADSPGVALKFLQAFEHTIHDLDHSHKVGGVTGTTSVTQCATFFMYVEGLRLDGTPAGLAKVQCDALILPNYPSTLLMGTAWLKPHRCIINFDNDLLTLGSLNDFHIPFLIRRWQGPLAQMDCQPDLIPFSSWSRQPHPNIPGEEVFTFKGAPGAAGVINPGPSSNAGYRGPIIPYPRDVLPPAYPPAGWMKCVECMNYLKIVVTDNICFKCRHKSQTSFTFKPNASAPQYHMSSGPPCTKCGQHGQVRPHDVCFECLVEAQDLTKRCPKCKTEIECIWDGEKFVWDTESEKVHQASKNCAAVFDTCMIDA